jgi:hypothetical protein
VEETIFAGDARKHVVRIEGGLRLLVKRPADEHELGHLTVGERVQVHCRPKDVRILGGAHGTSRSS